MSLLLIICLGIIILIFAFTLFLLAGAATDDDLIPTTYEESSFKHKETVNMKIIKNSDGTISLDLTDEEFEKLKPFLNRYGFIDQFPPEKYPEGYPRPVEVFDWMFPESIVETKKRTT